MKGRNLQDRYSKIIYRSGWVVSGVVYDMALVPSKGPCISLFGSCFEIMYNTGTHCALSVMRSTSENTTLSDSARHFDDQGELVPPFTP